MQIRSRISLALAVALYLALAAVTVRSVGVVGETAIGWALGGAPEVLVQADPVLWAGGRDSPTAGHALGPLVASQVRPIESLEIGGLALPLAINSYTGGPPDWPARAVFLLSGSTGAVTLLHVLLGAALIIGVHRFLRFHGTDIAAGVAVAVLAADWCFVFYKKVLGGTEVTLQLAGIVCLWALWDRRWSGGRHGLLKLGVGIGLGLLAKSTFGLTLAALALAALLTRWDKPTLGPPPPQSWWRPLAVVGVLLSPLLVATLHHALAVPAVPHVVSHDFASLQWERVVAALTGQRTPAREGLSNLLHWAGDPLAFFSIAYEAATPSPGWTPPRVIGWAVLAGGFFVAWADRHPTRHIALLRFMGIYLCLQVGLLLVVARDLHHLAQAAPTLAITAGLAIDRLASLTSPPRSPRRVLLALALALPWVGDGAWQLWRTDTVIESIEVPTFTRAGQEQLRDLLAEHDVERLVACDYESYGMLEVLAPEVEVLHGWGAASRRRGGVLPALIRLAEGGHFLVVEASAPMVYNLRPGPLDLEKSAGTLGLEVHEVGRLPGGRVVLYEIYR